MILKCIGSICIVASCAGLGFFAAYKQLQELKLLDQWIRILTRMDNEIRYYLRTIPELFHIVSYEEKGQLGILFKNTAEELDSQIQPDVERCIYAALCTVDALPPSIVELTKQLGREMGKYDLEGQLQAVERNRLLAEERKILLSTDKSKRIRGYQTLGLCAGAALVILFI